LLRFASLNFDLILRRRSPWYCTRSHRPSWSKVLKYEKRKRTFFFFFKPIANKKWDILGTRQFKKIEVKWLRKYNLKDKNWFNKSDCSKRRYRSRRRHINIRKWRRGKPRRKPYWGRWKYWELSRLRLILIDWKGIKSEGRRG